MGGISLAPSSSGGEHFRTVPSEILEYRLSAKRFQSPIVFIEEGLIRIHVNEALNFCLIWNVVSVTTGNKKMATRPGADGHCNTPYRPN